MARANAESGFTSLFYDGAGYGALVGLIIDRRNNSSGIQFRYHKKIEGYNQVIDMPGDPGYFNEKVIRTQDLSLLRREIERVRGLL